MKGEVCMTKITSMAADFIESFNYERIPQAVVEKAKLFVIDLMGVTVAGSAEPVGKIIREFSPLPGESSASIMGGSRKTTQDWAALVNGTSGHALDFDDVSEPMYGHPTVTVLPAALAVAENLGKSGSALIESYIIGLEFAVKLFYAMNPVHYEHGWHSTATMGSVGSTAAASKLYGLSGVQLRNALAMGCTQAFGIQQNFGTMTKPFHAGKAAQNGVIAAMLASRGWTGDQCIFEGPVGYFHVFCAPGEYHPEEFINHLGSPFVLEDSGLIIKKYPSCAFSHPAVDAAIEIAKNPKFKPSEVEKIESQILPINNQVLLHKKPKTGLEAKFSLEGCLAMALIDGNLNIRSFADESGLKPKIQAMMKKIERRVVENPGGNAQDFGPSSVRVFLRNGEVLEATVKNAKGTPQNPMSQAEIKEKYRNCCSGILAEKDIEKSLDLILRLDTLDRLDELMACYQPTA